MYRTFLFLCALSSIAFYNIEGLPIEKDETVVSPAVGEDDWNGLDDFGGSNENEDFRGGRHLYRKLRHIFHHHHHHKPIKPAPSSVKITGSVSSPTPIVIHNHAPEPVKITDVKTAKKLEIVVDKIKNETEKVHKEYQKKNDIKKMELEVNDLYRKYLEAKRLYELHSIKYNSSFTDWEKENREFEKEKHLLSHIYEFVKIYQSTTDKEKFYKTHCLCNSTLI